MKKFFVALTICLCCLAAHGQKTRFGEEAPHAKPGVAYPIKVHVSSVHYRTQYDGAGGSQAATYVDAIIEGKKVELQVTNTHNEVYGLPPLGNLQARLLKDPHNPNAPLFREYELLLPDNTIWRCVVTGIFE